MHLDKVVMPGIPVERKWYCCKKCGQKLLVYDNTAKSQGIYIRCKRCGGETEIKV